MQHVFADAFYWIALANPADQWHVPVSNFDKENPATKITTTEEVLTEFLNYFSESGERRRSVAVGICQNAISNFNIEVIAQSHESFEEGLTLLTQRTDKGYSLTDCISMIAMKDRGIDAVLSHDRHFAQEGFKVLF
jgi:predicted nucleic acid-binding protein